MSARESSVLGALGGRALRLAAGGRHRPRLSIFAYHRILERPDPLLPGEVTASSFESQMRLLADMCDVLPLPEAVARLAESRLQGDAACITFDDGYRSNFTVALPILRRLGLPATFFICTGYMQGGCMWNDAVIEAVRCARRDPFDLTRWGLGHVPIAEPRHGVVDDLLRKLKGLEHAERTECVAAIVAQADGGQGAFDLMMDRGQVLELHRLGMDIGAHTVAHPILTTIELSDARREIDSGAEQLRGVTGVRPRSFAYPNGRPHVDYAAAHVVMVRELGFELAVSTSFGVASPASDRWQLPRIVPWNQSSPKFLWRMVQGYTADEVRVAH